MKRWPCPCALGALVVLAGCQSAPVDPLRIASRHAEAGRFLEALQSLDRLPPSHADYTQARTLAQALERRIRTSQEKVLEGLSLRAEWRDVEAVRRFEEALEIWSHVVAARGLKTATENRIAALAADEAARQAGVDTAEPVGVVTTSPIGEVTTTPTEEITNDSSRFAKTLPAAPVAETESRDTAPDPRSPRSESREEDAAVKQQSSPRESGPASPHGKSVPPAHARTNTRRRRRMLGQARKLLGRGDMDRALDILRDLWDEAPRDRHVAAQLVRVWHHRALLAYGQGRLEAAIDDWKKVVRLDKDNAQVHAFMRAAKTELAARKRR
jgi:tetratricopeptide (TPR) repeat protein